MYNARERGRAYASRPLSPAFKPHQVIQNEKAETLAYACFSHRHDLLVRRESTYAGGPQGCPLMFKDRILVGKQAFERLRTYGIAIPFFSYVIAESTAQHRPCLLTVIERVNGKNVTDIAPASKKLARDVEGVFIRFLNYLKDTKESGGPFWSDFNIHQFMYGTLERDPHPRIYLVDVEPYAGKWPAPGSATPEAELMLTRGYLMQLMSVYLGIDGFETRNNNGILLKRARVLLEIAVRSIPPAPLYNEFRDNLLLLLTWKA
ncbi:MAG TPA: hypothetical protein VJ579_02300 [Candidatus Paceibacterota bacterium]|nr:hypothetical protein [Candidatus Paceibacterota bacterium]